MMRLWKTASAIGAIGLVAGCDQTPVRPVSAAPPLEAPGYQVQQLSMVQWALMLNRPEFKYTLQVFRLVNARRTAAGLSPLTLDTNLTRAAFGHSRDMAARNYDEHTSPEGVTFGQRIRAQGVTYTSAAENIFPLNPPDETVAQRAIDGWMASEGHRRNILNPAYKRTGIFGIKRASDGMWYFTQVFTN